MFSLTNEAVYVLDTFMDAAAAPLLDRLSVWLLHVIGGVREAVAAQAPKSPQAAPLIVSASRRLGLIVQRFARLATMMREGRLPASRTARSRPPLARKAPAGARRAPQAARLPSTRGWLIRLAPQTAQYRDQVRAWLADPEVVALLQSCERARRIVRPLCRMLAIRPELELGGLEPGLAHPLARRRSPAQTGGEADGPAGTRECVRPRPRRRAAAPRPRTPRLLALREFGWRADPEWADGFT
jgi:hypothetical protein